jgi:outer membrane receptor protein involved in Fe transport
MNRKHQVAAAVRRALVMGALTAAGAAPALAQEAQQGAQGLEEIIITGTRIQKANLVTSSPVATIDAAQMEFTGVTRVEDVMSSIPQVALDQDSGQSIESNGTATLQLRNLGSSRTLVLMDGKRLPISSPSSSESAADINFIPMALLERVDVLTGGASSTYGSDAVAGVVNFVMVKDFEGVKVDYQASGYRHDNSGNLVADASIAKGFDVPTGTASDGGITDITFLMGVNANEGRGNITAYATYRDISAVTQDKRDYSACAINIEADGAACIGSGTSAEGSFYFYDKGLYFHTVGNEFVPGFAYFNFAPPSYFQRPDQRYTLGALGHYELSEHADVYTQLMFMDDRTVAQFAPAGMFFDGGVTIPCYNPLLSAQQYAAMECGSPDEVVNVVLGRRNVEGGPRFGDLRHTTYRGVFGVRGDINDAWRYDASAQRSEVDMRNRNGNYTDVGKMTRALDVDPSGVCTSVIDGSDPNCVPWNVFQTGGVTREQTDYFAMQYFERGTTEQNVGNAYVQGSLGEYGVKLPWAESGIDVIFGGEFREEDLEYIPDDLAQAGVVGGLSAALVPVSGGFSVWELFTEASIPIVEDKTGAKALTLDLGYRYSDYDTGVQTDTYKAALGWAINDTIKLRGSFQRAVRAPNIVDMFQPQAGTLFSMEDDPCGQVVNGISIGGYTFEECARSGVSQAVWDSGGPSNSPAKQYNTLLGGSTELDPEESETVSFGFLFTPTFVPGLTLSVDYYDIDVQKAITEIEPETILTQLCIEQNINCELVHRGIGDTLWIGNSSATNGIVSLSQNIGFFRVKGIDFEGTYRFDIGRGGSLMFNDRLGYIDSWEQEEYPGAGVVHCEGVYGGSCGPPTFEMVNNFSTTWQTPWDVSVNLTWRHLDKVTQVPDDIVDMPSQEYFDLAATWDVTEYASIRLGINNILDEAPPIVSNGVTLRNNGNVYTGAYDHLGMYWFLGGTVHF